MASYICILGDSHDAGETLTAALELLKGYDPLAYVHVGDVCSPGMLELCTGLAAPFHFVLGNNDFDEAGLRGRAAALGLHYHGHCGELTVEGKRMAFLHGDRHALLDELVDGQQYDYVFHGHTHARASWRRGRTRIINPGALYRAKEKTVAVVELHSDAVEFLTVATP